MTTKTAKCAECGRRAQIIFRYADKKEICTRCSKKRDDAVRARAELLRLPHATPDVFTKSALDPTDIEAVRKWVVALKWEREEATAMFAAEREHYQIFAEEVRRWFHAWNRGIASGKRSARWISHMTTEGFQLERWSVAIEKRLQSAIAAWPDIQLSKKLRSLARNAGKSDKRSGKQE